MHEPIAIVGMACRFPGQVNDTGKLWKLMMESRSAFSDVPPERFSQDAFYHPDSKNNGTFNAKGGHFLHDDISRFDATFFNIAPAEAKAMDPQLRLLMEVSYEAFENGGFTLDQVRGSNTGVYTALYNRDYEKMMFRDPENMPFYASTGNGEAMFSNRLSYFFDLKGPSLTLDTGCSGSLVALHSACTSLWAGESEQSVVAASNLILDPLAMVGPSFMQFLSPDGQSYSFDSRACGYGRGEGTACVILKPLSKALSDGDNIRSIIRSCVTNQDGRTQGITMPDLNAQKSLIEKAYLTAGLDPRDTVYAEAHGSGTAAGDYAESAALGSVLGSKRPRYDPLIIGSIKTNIGHLENASRLAALIKTVLIIENGCIPSNTNFESPNPSIDFNHLNLKVATAAQSLSHTESRQVSISSFGYGGTNCHVVLDKEPAQESIEMSATRGQEAHQPCREDDESGNYLFVLSARSKASSSLIANQTQEYLNRPNNSSPGFLRSLAYTLCKGRSRFQWRQALVANSLDELQRSLQNSPVFHHTTTTPDPCFIFTGQGSQWLGMGKELFQSSSIFRDSIRAAERHLLCFGAKWRLTDELLSSHNSSSLNTAQVAQPACTAIQLALLNLLSSWNVKPRAVIGHSSGEIAAAYACDAISFNDALLAAYARGTCAADLAKQKEISGGMLAAGLSEEVARGYLDLVDGKFGTVKVACINSPQSVTLSGDEAAIGELHNLLQKNNVFVRRLPVDVAYHSHHMTRVAQIYRNALERLGSPTTSASVSFFSSVEGRLIDTSILDRDYWVRNLVSPVLFSQAMEHLCREFSSEAILVEVGPHAGLKGPVRQCLEHRQKVSGTDFHYTSMLIRNQSARKTTLLAAGELFIHGCDIDLNTVNFQSSHDKSKLLSDLPPYPWDHSTSYWHEGRLSNNYRKRQHAPHELLGVPAPDSSIFEPRWRKYIRLTEMPWLSGHKVQNRIVFPGAGYLCMVFEAGARYFTQSTSEANKIASITLSEVSFTQPLILSDSQEAVEVMTVLRPSGNYNGRDLSRRHEFIIYSAPDTTKVVEHCRGFISISSKHIPSAPAELTYPGIDSNMMSNVSSETFYEEVRTSCGLEYSGSFAGISSISAGVGSSQTTITTSKAHQGLFVQPWGSALHPSTLDACMQSVLPAVLSEPRKKRPLVLSDIKEVTLIPGSTKPQTGLEETYNVTCRVSRSQKDAYVGALSMNTSSKDALVLSMTSVVLSEMDGRSQTASSQSATEAQKLGKHLDPILLSAKDTEDICYTTTDDASIGTELRSLDRACGLYAQGCLNRLHEEDLHRLEPFQIKYLDWLRGMASREVDKNPQDPEDDAEFLALFEKEGCIRTMVSRIGRNLPQILKGEEEALSVMMKDGLLHAFYQEDQGIQRCAQQAAEYAHLLGLKNPNLRILEIGGGTGSATWPILDSLTGAKRNLFQHYVFTDISSGFFPKAGEKFARWKDSMSFQALNIEESPESQNLDLESYDLVIAANVLHATSQIKRTMGHVRSLLKPGGTLLLVESTKPTAYRSFIFGTLPGWWLGSSERKGDGPLLTVQEWDSFMRETGFCGVAVCTHAYKNPDEQIDSLIISHALSDKCHVSDDSMRLVLSKRQFHGEDGGFGRKLAVSLAHALSVRESSIICLGDPSASGKQCITLAGLEQSILATCNESDFLAIKDTLHQALEIIWITRGATGACQHPDSSLAVGLLRVFRRENPAIRALNVDLDPTGDRSIQEMTMCLKHFIGQLHLLQNDNEWIEHDGQWFVPRLVTDTLVSSVLASHSYASSSETLQTKTLKEADRPLRLAASQSKTLLDLHFVEDTSFNCPLADDEVEIEVRATGINFRDPLIILGVLDSPLVGECSGVILNVGTNYKHRFQQGDRVYTSYVAGHATRVRAKGSLTYPLPLSLSFAEATSIPIIYGTIYYSLVTVARLQPGESVLIHAGAGGVGQAAIVLAKHIGAVIYTTVGSQEKRDKLMRCYGIPDGHIFSSRNTDFVHSIQRATQGAGVDVVLNSLTGNLLQSSMDVLAEFGRFVELGKADASSHARMDMSVFTKPVSFTSVDLYSLSMSRPRDVVELQASVHKLVEEGIFVPPSPVRVYPVSQMEEAFRQVQTGKHMGKSVLTYEGDCTVKVAPRSLQHNGLREDASYLIIGGQGGLGREICLWMARNGARNLIILSPSGASKPTVQTLKDDLLKMGTKLHAFSCDVGNAEKLQSTLAICHSSLPPIQGVMFAAVSLRDTVFEDMAFKDYLHVLNCKMTGLVRLHDALQQQPPLDFFIILSSYSGLTGNPGQANYSAASTYQDAFARWRTSQGFPTRSIDLGIIEGAGYVHENPASTQHLQKSGTGTVPLTSLLTLLEYAVCCPPDTSTSSQIAIGWKPGPKLEGSVDQSLFSHLICSESEPSKEGSSQSVSPDDLLRNALGIAKSQSPDAVVQLEAAISRYVSNALGVPIEDVDPLQSMSHHGGDSLVLVEFRNWIEKGVGSPLGIGKDLGQIPLRELARLTANSVDKEKRLIRNTTTVDTTSVQQKHTSSSEKVCNGDGSISPSWSVEMSPLPLPSLEQTIDRYLRTVRPLVSEQEWLSTSQKAKNFLAPNGVGAELQKRLQYKRDDPEVRNWLDKIYAEVRYLRDRRPLVPYSSFFGVHDSDFLGLSEACSPAVTAALISWSAFQFKQLYETGELACDVFYDRPVCTGAYRWIFNASRIPGAGEDSRQKWLSENHLIAMRNGNAFKISLLVGGRPANVEELTGAFQRVIDLGDSMPKSHVGALTNDYRDIWNKNRRILKALNNDNAAALGDIESSDFVVCLDRASPRNADERVSQFWKATGSNRWHGKSLQFIVCDNGVSGVIGEHSMIDGITGRHLTTHMKQAFLDHPVDQPNVNVKSSNYPEPVPLPISMSETLESHVEALSLETNSRLQEFQVHILDIEQYGSQSIRQNHFNPGAFVNLVVQLAFHRLYGKSVPSIEAVSMSSFFQGRLDFCRLVTDEVVAFCKGMENPSDNPEQCRLLFTNAAATHVRNITAVRDGEGIDMHFMALIDMARESRVNTDLFVDQVFKYSRSHTVSTMTLSHHTSELGSFPVTEDGWRIAYMIKENSVRFIVISQHPRHEELCGQLRRASQDVADLWKHHQARNSE